MSDETQSDDGHGDANAREKQLRALREPTPDIPPPAASPAHSRELSWADLVLLIAGFLLISPLIISVGDVLVSALRSLPIVGGLLTPGIVAALVLLAVVHLLPVGGRSGYGLGSGLVAVGILGLLVPLFGQRLAASGEPIAYWSALAGCLVLLRSTNHLGCARAATVSLILLGFLIGVVGYPPVAYSVVGLWLTVAAGVLLAVSGREPKRE